METSLSMFNKKNSALLIWFLCTKP